MTVEGGKTPQVVVEASETLGRAALKGGTAAGVAQLVWMRQELPLGWNGHTLFSTRGRTLRHRDVIIAVHRFLLGSRRGTLRHDNIVVRICG